MKFHPFVSIPTAALVVFTASYPVLAQAQRATERVRAATEVLQGFVSNTDQRIPPTVLQQAQGIAIIPRLVQAGFIFGGQRGAGLMMVRRADRTWSNPAFITVTGGSIGAQIGAQSRDLVLVFRDQATINQLFQDTVTFGGDVQAAAGPVGAQVLTPTDRPDAQVFSYSRTEGLFAGVAASGVNVSYDQDLTQQFYNRPGITVQQVFYGSPLATPPVVANLQQLLNQAAIGRR